MLIDFDKDIFWLLRKIFKNERMKTERMEKLYKSVDFYWDSNRITLSLIILISFFILKLDLFSIIFKCGIFLINLPHIFIQLF